MTNRVVGVDGTRSLKALMWAAHRAELHEVPLRIIRTPTPGGGPPGLSTGSAPALLYMAGCPVAVARARTVYDPDAQPGGHWLADRG